MDDGKAKRNSNKKKEKKKDKSILKRRADAKANETDEEESVEGTSLKKQDVPGANNKVVHADQKSNNHQATEHKTPASATTPALADNHRVDMTTADQNKKVAKEEALHETVSHSDKHVESTTTVREMNIPGSSISIKETQVSTSSKTKKSRQHRTVNMSESSRPKSPSLNEPEQSSTTTTSGSHDRDDNKFESETARPASNSMRVSRSGNTDHTGETGHPKPPPQDHLHRPGAIPTPESHEKSARHVDTERAHSSSNKMQSLRFHDSVGVNETNHSRSQPPNDTNLQTITHTSIRKRTVPATWEMRLLRHPLKSRRLGPCNIRPDTQRLSRCTHSPATQGWSDLTHHPAI